MHATLNSTSENIFKISKEPSQKIEHLDKENCQVKFIEGRWTKVEKTKLYDEIILKDIDISWRKVFIFAL